MSAITRGELFAAPSTGCFQTFTPCCIRAAAADAATRLLKRIDFAAVLITLVFITSTGGFHYAAFAFTLLLLRRLFSAMYSFFAGFSHRLVRFLRQLFRYAPDSHFDIAIRAAAGFCPLFSRFRCFSPFSSGYADIFLLIISSIAVFFATAECSQLSFR